MSSRLDLPLSGLRVVDLSDRLAGAYCTKLLVDVGADVIKVEPPAGDPLRNRPSPIPDSATRRGLLFEYLSSSKRSVVLDLETSSGIGELGRLARHADLIVESWTPGVAERRGLALSDLQQFNPSLSMVSISPFGRGGPRSEEDAPEFVVQALSGAIYSRGRPDRDPLFVSGGLSEWIAGAFGAAGGLAAWLAGSTTGIGSHVDVSILEAAALSLVTAPVIANSVRGYPIRVSGRRAVPGIERCSDGWVGIFVLTAQQWFDFTAMIERPELSEDTSLVSLIERQNRDQELVPLIEEWTSQRTAKEVLTMAELLRIPAAPIGNGQSIPEFDAIVAREIYVANPAGFRQPRSMFHFEGVPRREVEPAPALGETKHVTPDWRSDDRITIGGGSRALRGTADRPLEGVRIIDLTAFWAGPAATAVLGALGAEVIKIESIQHPDPLRFAGYWPLTKPLWYEASPLFGALNLDKQSLTLDLGSEEGRAILLSLVETADVVVENFTPRVLDNFKLGYEQFRAAKADIILARMPAFGLDGPWRDRPGFGPTLEQISGMAWINGYEDTEPIAPNGYIDPAAGAHLAFAIVSALILRARTGQGTQLELPMVEVATAMTAEQVIEYDLTGQIQSRLGNADAHATPQGAYECQGDGEFNWVAVSVQDDDQWRSLSALLEVASWPDARPDDLASASGRWKFRSQIDAHLRSWCGARQTADVVETLSRADVPVAPVVPDHEIVSDSQMQARGFWQQVDHPVTGEQWYAGFPFRRPGGEWYQGSAPVLGQDNEAVLTSLGFSPDQIRELEERKVIGRIPLGL